MNGTVLPISTGEQVVVTTQLMQIEAQITQGPKDPNQTTYHLIIDFESSDAIVDITATMDPVVLGALVLVLKEVIKKNIGNGHQYQVATFTLTKVQANKYRALIPYVADFTFVQDTKTPGRSNLLVLMQTVSQTKGSILFSAPLLSSVQNFAVLMSNKLFLQYFVLPPLISKIQGEAKNRNAVPGQIALHAISQQPFLYEAANTGNIPLNQDHHPWISQITASIDTSMQALCLYLDAQANVTFLNIHVDAWDRSWLQFRIDAKTGNISLVQIKENKNSSTSLNWWEWLIAIVLGPIPLIVTGIIDAIVSGQAPDLGGTFATVGQNLVQWPNQKTVILKQITTPNHVVITLDVNFQA